MEVTSFSTHELDVDSPLSSLGIYSLMRIELAGRLRKVFAGQAMDFNSVAETETVQGMVDKISSSRDISARHATPKQLNGASLSKALLSSPQMLVLERSIATLAVGNTELSNFVLLKGSSEESTPLHVFHGGSGQVTYYKRLEDLGRCIYGLADPYFSTLECRHGSLVDMAVDYMSKLKYHTKGPFLLGGKSVAVPHFHGPC